MNLLIVLQQMSVLFAMMLTGFVVCRLGWIQSESYQTMSRLVVNVFNPILILFSVHGKTFDGGNEFLENLIFVGIFYVLLTVLSFLFLWISRPDRLEAPIYQLMIIFPNVGFMGIPLVAALLGTEYIIYVAIYMLFYNILIYTFGIWLVSRNSSSHEKTLSARLLPLLKNPGILSSILAMLIFFLQIPMAAPVVNFCDYMGNTSIALSMFLIGCSIAVADIRQMLKNTRMYIFLAFRLIFVPLIGILFCKFLPFDPTLKLLFVIMLSMPAGSMVVLINTEYGSPSDCASSGVVLSTLFSLLSIPFISLFL